MKSRDKKIAVARYWELIMHRSNEKSKKTTTQVISMSLAFDCRQ